MPHRRAHAAQWKASSSLLSPPPRASIYTAIGRLQVRGRTSAASSEGGPTYRRFHTAADVLEAPSRGQRVLNHVGSGGPAGPKTPPRGGDHRSRRASRHGGPISA